MGNRAHECSCQVAISIVVFPSQRRASVAVVFDVIAVWISKIKSFSTTPAVDLYAVLYESLFHFLELASGHFESDVLQGLIFGRLRGAFHEIQ